MKHYITRTVILEAPKAKELEGQIEYLNQTGYILMGNLTVCQDVGTSKLYSVIMQKTVPVDNSLSPEHLNVEEILRKYIFEADDEGIEQIKKEIENWAQKMLHQAIENHAEIINELNNELGEKERVTCPECKGRGDIKKAGQDYSETCPTCDGLKSIMIKVKKSAPIYPHCQICYGKGCRECNFKGFKTDF